MKCWKEKKAGMMALLLCFALVACSSEESSSTGSSGSTSSSTESSTVQKEEPVVESTEDDSDATDLEEAVADESEELVEESVGGDDAVVAEYTAYAEELYEYVGGMMFLMMSVEDMVAAAGENVDDLTEVAVMMDECAAELSLLRDMAVPDDLKVHHGEIANGVDELMGAVTRTLYLTVEVLELLEGYETKTEAELLAILSDAEAIQDEILGLEASLDTVGEQFTASAEEVDTILASYLGEEFLAELEAEIEAQVEAEYTAIFG